MIFCQVLLVILAGLAVANGDQCQQGVNCHLPDCFCPAFSHPMGRNNIPQIVYFGFDDAVTPLVGGFFDKLFTPERRNPNGCPITMSLYVCHKYTDYSLVRGYFEDNDEIAVHSVTHTFIDTAEKLYQEALNQKENIMIDANIPGSDIIGWRSPDLITAGDDQPRILKELNYTYDISLPYDSAKKVAFPFTLDYGYPYGCSIRPCPGKHTYHKGFWEVPINTLYDFDKNIPCTYVDGCRPDSEDAAFQFLMDNFYRSYNKERAPFGLNMHAAWFYFPKYMKAMARFIDELLTNFPNDVYIVNVQQMMAWMRTPKTIEESKTFAPWGCQNRKTKVNAKPKARVDYPIGDEPGSNLNAMRAWFLKSKVNTASSPQHVHKKNRLGESLLFRSLKNPQ